MSAQTCKYCSRPAVTDSVSGVTVNPPMCAQHYDLLITVEFIIGRNQEPTPGLVLALLERARERGGTLAITDEEVPELLPGVLAALGHGAPAPELPADPKNQ